MTVALDLSFVRSQFPAFAEPALADQAFFENAGGSYACREVGERLADYYRRYKVQPYGAYEASRRAGELMDGAYQALAGYLGVSAGQIHLGPSTSQNTYVLAQALGQGLRPGEEILVTNQDHEANSGVWRRLQARGAVLREWRVEADSGLLQVADLRRLLNERTRLLAFPHCSNILGQFNPVREICDLARAAGALTVVDGVSYAPHGFPDVPALGADVYLFSLYKTFGPHQGVMVLAPGAAEVFGNEGHYFNAGQSRKRLVPAGPDHAQVAAAAGVPAYFDALCAHHGIDPDRRRAELQALIRSAEVPLLERVLDYLSSRPEVRLLGPADARERAPTVSFVSARRRPAQIAADLAARGVMAGAGHFYALRLLEAMGVEAGSGVARLSLVHYTTAAEVDKLLGALDQVL